MLLAAAQAVAHLSDAEAPDGVLLPYVTDDDSAARAGAGEVTAGRA